MYYKMSENEYRTSTSSNKMRKNCGGCLVNINQQKAIFISSQNKQTYSSMKSKIHNRPKKRTLKLHK